MPPGTAQFFIRLPQIHTRIDGEKFFALLFHNEPFALDTAGRSGTLSLPYRELPESRPSCNAHWIWRFAKDLLQVWSERETREREGGAREG
jgi:hypothetical protein